MFESMLNRFCKEFDLSRPQKDKRDSYSLEVNSDITLQMRDLDPGLYLHSLLATYIETKKEDFNIFLMSANLLGQGTEKTVIGLDQSGKFLTLSLTMSYELKYIEYKEAVEDFVNYLLYWRAEIDKFKKNATKTII